MIADPREVVLMVMAMIMAVVVMMMVIHNDIEVIEREKPGEPVTVPPEWPGIPGIQVRILPGRRVVGNNRRTVLIVIVLDRFRTFANGRRSLGQGRV